MRKIRPDATETINRLFQIVLRSLPVYLAGADPWAKSPDDPARKALDQVVADAKFYSGRIAEMILDRRAQLDSGDFPMEFTDLNMLSMDYLVRELIRCQRTDIQAVEQCVSQLTDDLPARVLAEEVLGNMRGHLETLEELTKRPPSVRLAS